MNVILKTFFLLNGVLDAFAVRLPMELVGLQGYNKI